MCGNSGTSKADNVFQLVFAVFNHKMIQFSYNTMVHDCVDIMMTFAAGVIWITLILNLAIKLLRLKLGMQQCPFCHISLHKVSTKPSPHSKRGEKNQSFHLIKGMAESLCRAGLSS